MQLILTQDVDNLGNAGDLVSVKSGYGRNYLLPQGLAVSATTRNQKKREHDLRTIEARVKKELGAASGVADKINGMTLQFERLVGEDDRLFGSVTANDIAQQLGVAGTKIDHRKIKLSEPIRTLGKYETDIKLHSQITATLKFWVVAKDK